MTDPDLPVCMHVCVSVCLSVWMPAFLLTGPWVMRYMKCRTLSAYRRSWCCLRFIRKLHMIMFILLYIVYLIIFWCISDDWELLVFKPVIYKVDVTVIQLDVHVCRVVPKLSDAAAESTCTWTVPSSHRMLLMSAFWISTAIALCATVSSLSGYIDQVCCFTSNRQWLQADQETSRC